MIWTPQEKGPHGSPSPPGCRRHRLGSSQVAPEDSRVPRVPLAHQLCYRSPLRVPFIHTPAGAGVNLVLVSQRTDRSLQSPGGSVGL